MTQGEVRVFQECTGHLGSTPLPIIAVNIDIAEILANYDGIIRTGERDLVDDLIWAKLTLRHPEIRTLGGKSREEEEYENSHDDGDQLVKGL